MKSFIWPTLIYLFLSEKSFFIPQFGVLSFARNAELGNDASYVAFYLSSFKRQIGTN